MKILFYGWLIMWARLIDGLAGVLSLGFINLGLSGRMYNYRTQKAIEEQIEYDSPGHPNYKKWR